VSFGDGHTCHMKVICTIRIKLFDLMVRELKGVRYVTSVMNVISIGALKAHGLRGTFGEGILKMFSGLLIVLKGIRHNNLYYLKGSVVTGNLAASERLDGDSTEL